MATKSGMRAPPDGLKKASGTFVEGNSRRPPPLQVTKTSKSEPVTPNKLSRHLQRVSSKKIIANSIDESESLHSSQKGSINEIANQLESNLLLEDDKKLPNSVPVSMTGNGGSPEAGVESQNKTPEHGVGSSSGEVSDGTGSFAKTSGSAKTSGRADFFDNGKSSMCRGSTSSVVSDESTCSSLSSVNKTHKANDLWWEAIQAVRARDGALGLNHFRLLKGLGCGDIGSVYLSELS